MSRIGSGSFALRLIGGVAVFTTVTATIAMTAAQAAPSAGARSVGITVPRWQGAGPSALVPGPYYRPPAGRSSDTHADVAGRSAWAIQRTPNLRAGNGTLANEACPAPRNCQAVGSAADLSGASVTLAEKWDGNTWSTEATPPKNGALASALSGVSCAATNACIAVGGFIDASQNQLPLAEAWNGVAWNIQPMPNPAGSRSTFLSAVSCVGPLLCMAVGSQSGVNGPGPLAELWNGARWRVVPTPGPTNGFGALSAVSCAAPDACIAVGTSSFASLAESWNGTSWHLQLTPNPAGSFLAGVSCPATHDCRAVGGYLNPVGLGVPLAEAWNGRVWTKQAAPHPAGAAESALLAVSCATTIACTSVGSSDGAPLAEGFNGTAWRLQSIPGPAGGTNASLTGVSCPSVRNCGAVGSYVNRAVIGMALAEGSRGGTWTIQAARNPVGSFTSVLEADSCPGAAHCEAVGLYLAGVGGGTLAEVRSGPTWSVERTANPAGATQSSLLGVACASADQCMAVGQSVGPAGTVTLAETWNGRTWRIVRTPTPVNSFTSALEAVSCSAPDACTAVGTDSTNNGQATLAEAWNGKTWRIQSTPDPPGTFADVLTGVSCVAATACSAVGNDVDLSGTQVPLAESWDGTAWKIHHTPVPAGSLAAAMFGVWCTTANACTGVGGHVDPAQIGKTLIETWNGTAWRIQASPNPAGAPFATLYSVRCGRGACTAVGSTGLATMALAWHWTAWTVQPTPDPVDAANSALLGVDCSAANVCTAVGAWINLAGFESTLAEAGG
jgi:hypothetical protein